MKNKNIALVLSSGGARGIAHIGVIEELKARGYNITSISGTSIGAVIGGFYAAGKLQEYSDWVCSLGPVNIFNLIDVSFSTKGIIKGKRVFKKMSEWMKGVKFEDLNIPFACVAVDLINRKQVIFDKGDVMRAIRASVAIPGYFEPQVIDGIQLYDGGVLNPIPLDIIKRNEGDLLFAVDLNTNDYDFDRKNYFEGEDEQEESQILGVITDLWNTATKHIEVLQLKHSNETRKTEESEEQRKKKHYTHIRALTEMFDLVQENVTREDINTHNPDLVIRIPQNLCSTFEFHKSKELVEFGRIRAKEALDLYEAQLASTSSQK